MVLPIALTSSGIGAPVVNPETLASIRFPMPQDRAHREYLGLGAGDSFTLGQIKADAVMVELFSMYCPICQSEAPKVNDLHRVISQDQSLKARVRFLGIGIGNTPYEVEVFRKKFKIPFPLVPDEDFTAQKAVSEKIRTPTFLVLRIELGKRLRPVGVHVGEILKPQEFLETLAGSVNR